MISVAVDIDANAMTDKLKADMAAAPEGQAAKAAQDYVNSEMEKCATTDAAKANLASAQAQAATPEFTDNLNKMDERYIDWCVTYTVHFCEDGTAMYCNDARLNLSLRECSSEKMRLGTSLLHLHISFWIKSNLCENMIPHDCVEYLDY